MSPMERLKAGKAHIKEKGTHEKGKAGRASLKKDPIKKKN